MKTKSILVMVFATLILSNCAPPEPAMTPLEIQSIQTREYEATKDIVFPSVVSVFQDIGYTITNADFQTGLISAESAAESGSLLFTTTVNQVKATAFVERIGDKTRARLNFVEIFETSGGYGQTTRQDTPVLDVKWYENAFERIENAIFVRSSS